MTFYNQLVSATREYRARLLAAPLIKQALAGQISRDQYIAILTEAYHHDKHTVLLLMAAGARHGGGREWRGAAVAEYIEEELSHQERVLKDIAACRAAPEAVRGGQPGSATDLKVAYDWDMVQRVDP